MKMLLSNNSRKMAGLPLHRKKDKRKRSFTRCEADETIKAFLDYCNRKQDEETRSCAHKNTGKQEILKNQGASSI